MNPLEIKPLDDQRKIEQSFIAKTPMSAYICASKNSGKSTLLLNMILRHWKGEFNSIIWVSPTAKLDKKIQVLKETPGLLAKNEKLIKLMKKLNKTRRILGDTEDLDYPDKMQDEDYMEELTVDFLLELLSDQKKVIEQFGKSFGDNILLVLDDCIESNIIKDKRFTDFIFKSRHFKISCIIISQSYFSLPKRIRLNSTQMIIFFTGNKKELKSIYEENANNISFDKFEEFFYKATNESYGFLNINYNNDKDHRFSKSFLEFLQ